MKKIFLTALAICLLSVTNVASAQFNYNFVPMSGLNVQTFVNRMGNCSVAQVLASRGISIVISPAVYQPDLEDPENFPGLEAYMSLFGVEGSGQINGGICFFVDPNRDCVFAMQMVNSGYSEVSDVVLLMVMDVLGLNEREATTLIQVPPLVAETWCANTGRKIIRIADPQNDKVMLLASNN